MKLRELHENAKAVEIFESNFEGSKQMVIKIQGIQYVLSQKLSEKVRKGEVQLDELGSYEVREVQTQDGTTINSLGLEGGKSTAIIIGNWKGDVKDEAPKEVTLADFKARFFKQTVALS